jgi:hypothetical protein
MSATYTEVIRNWAKIFANAELAIAARTANHFFF